MQAKIYKVKKNKRKMVVIVFLNIKGGVAKTTSACNVAHIMATKFGMKVLLIDMDPQGNTSTMFSTGQDEEALFKRIKSLLSPEIYYEEDDDDNSYSISDILLDVYNKTDIHQAIHKTEYENIDIIPSQLKLADDDFTIQSNVKFPPTERLREHLSAVEDEYDFCIIDCSPSVGIANLNALYVADEVYMPLKNDAYSLEGVGVAYNLLKTVKKHNPKLKVGGAFVTQVQKSKLNELVESLLDTYFSEYKIPISIRHSVKVGESTFNCPILEADPNAKLNPTQDYIALTEYILNKERD